MSDNPKRCANYLRLILLVVDIGTDLTRKVFYQFIPKNQVKAFFKSTTILDELKTLTKHHVINRCQFDLLRNDPDPDTFDLSLLVTLLTNLFKHNIDNPINGWDKEIDEKDTTLGADLMRLKLVRNSIVGHRPHANIPQSDFEALWKETEAVLIRIATDIGERVNYHAKIIEYKTAKLENNDKFEKTYDELRTWHEEYKKDFSDLQKKMEIYLKKAEEYQVFFRNVPERYWRYILLLYEGGMTVLTSLLHKLLQSQGTDLKQILNENKGEIMKSLYIADRIFFKNETNTNIETWGLSALAKVVETLFSSQLDILEVEALQYIRDASNSFSETALDSLDSDKFRSHWTNISTSITTLAIGLDRNTQSQCVQLIKKHDSGPVDEDLAKSYVSLLQRDFHPFRSMIAMYIDTREKLKEIVREMCEEGIGFAQDKVVELKMMTFGGNEEKKNLAEDILCTVWNEAIEISGNSENFPDVKRAVEDILQGIRGIRGVKISSAERHCIFVKIFCETYLSVLELLKFLEDNSCWETLNHQLSDHFHEEIVVTGFITVESMQFIANLPKPGKNGVTLHLACSSVEAMDDVHDFVRHKLIYQTARARSKKVHCDFYIRLKLNRNELSEVLHDTLSETSLQGRFRLNDPELSDEHVSQMINEHERLQHLSKTLTDIKLASRRTDSLPSDGVYSDSQTEDMYHICSDFPGSSEPIRDRRLDYSRKRALSLDEYLSTMGLELGKLIEQKPEMAKKTSRTNSVKSFGR